jgi:hypothetical protein
MEGEDYGLKRFMNGPKSKNNTRRKKSFTRKALKR